MIISISFFFSSSFQQGGPFGRSYVQYEPRKLIKSGKFLKVACSYSFSVGLSTDGEVYGWGKNFIPDAESLEPKLIPFPSKIKDLSVGANHCAAIDVDGALYTWGNGGSFFKGGGQLGHGSRNAENSPR